MWELKNYLVAYHASPGLAASELSPWKKASVCTMVDHLQEWWISNVLPFFFMNGSEVWDGSLNCSKFVSETPSSKVPLTLWHEDEIGRFQAQTTLYLPYNPLKKRWCRIVVSCCPPFRTFTLSALTTNRGFRHLFVNRVLISHTFLLMKTLAQSLKRVALVTPLWVVLSYVTSQSVKAWLGTDHRNTMRSHGILAETFCSVQILLHLLCTPAFNTDSE